MSTPSLQLRLSMEQVEPRTYDICENRHKGSAESVAANPTDENKRLDREVLLMFIKSQGRLGGTAKEFADFFGKGLNCVSGRFKELRDAGLIFKNGQRRDKSAVHVAGV